MNEPESKILSKMSHSRWNDRDFGNLVAPVDANQRLWTFCVHVLQIWRCVSGSKSFARCRPSVANSCTCWRHLVGSGAVNQLSLPCMSPYYTHPNLLSLHTLPFYLPISVLFIFSWLFFYRASVLILQIKKLISLASFSKNNLFNDWLFVYWYTCPDCMYSKF